MSLSDLHGQVWDPSVKSCLGVVSYIEVGFPVPNTCMVHRFDLDGVLQPFQPRSDVLRGADMSRDTGS